MAKPRFFSAMVMLDGEDVFFLENDGNWDSIGQVRKGEYMAGKWLAFDNDHLADYTVYKSRDKRINAVWDLIATKLCDMADAKGEE